mmetsp:Transcript_21141/g.56343  ORF Transcript_21141/g.56343 Transcript_21141/m.56343 type:complete len:280 (-) Transcript_21141:110-949(-)|eukprot:CAMPEP_0194538122 /NCGR_PEP_ID=MMETSP0253-20130528/77583_1 /TAXON_ID=2966 /ORGANISM="Noctiluca scintillans" /LENGTH=279 /DNA_ID=CAMNT_0039384199 /DNA_START=326 /DNA_END=1165 /DNA_ORIENTATION=+
MSTVFADANGENHMKTFPACATTHLRTKSGRCNKTAADTLFLVTSETAAIPPGRPSQKTTTMTQRHTNQHVQHRTCHTVGYQSSTPWQGHQVGGLAVPQLASQAKIVATTHAGVIQHQRDAAGFHMMTQNYEVTPEIPFRQRRGRDLGCHSLTIGRLKARTPVLHGKELPKSLGENIGDAFELGLAGRSKPEHANHGILAAILVNVKCILRSNGVPDGSVRSVSEERTHCCQQRDDDVQTAALRSHPSHNKRHCKNTSDSCSHTYVAPGQTRLYHTAPR